MAVNYTAGAYTVTSPYLDTLRTVNVTRKVPSIDWSADYSQKSISNDKCELVNRTGSALGPSEKVTITRTELNDVYKNASADASHRLADTRGVRVMIQDNVEYKAVNSTTGEEYSIPARAWICVETSVAPIVQETIPKDVVNRILGMLTQSLSSETLATEGMSTVIDAIKGDLSPKAVNALN